MDRKPIGNRCSTICRIHTFDGKIRFESRVFGFFRARIIDLLGSLVEEHSPGVVILMLSVRTFFFSKINIETGRILEIIGRLFEYIKRVFFFKLKVVNFIKDEHFTKIVVNVLELRSFTEADIGIKMIMRIREIMIKFHSALMALLTFSVILVLS